MSDQKVQITRWVRRGQYAVEVEVEGVYPEEDPLTLCLEPSVVKFLDEVARRAETGDVDYLRKIGRVYQALSA